MCKFILLKSKQNRKHYQLSESLWNEDSSPIESFTSYFFFIEFSFFWMYSCKNLTFSIARVSKFNSLFFSPISFIVWTRWANSYFGKYLSFIANSFLWANSAFDFISLYFLCRVVVLEDDFFIMSVFELLSIIGYDFIF